MRFKNRRPRPIGRWRDASCRSERVSRRQRAGTTLVEFAIICNLLFIVIFTCMEFARMNMARNLVQDAAYYAARVAIVPGATPAEAEAEAERILSAIFTDGYTIECSDLDEESEQVSVRVAINLDDVALFTAMFLGNIELESTATMRTERYTGFFEQ